MINTGFVILSWLIGISALVGPAAVIAGLIFAPAIVFPLLSALVKRFIECIWCIVVVVFLLSTVGAYWVGRHGEYERGHSAAIAAIAAEDEETITNATNKREVWRACRARSGTWDQSTGDCK